MSAASGIQDQYVPQLERPHISLTLPVLVTGGELYGASLDPSGDMHVDDLSHAFVKTPHPSGGSGSDVDVLSFVHVMTTSPTLLYPA
jgi:hypothetical protein